MWICRLFDLFFHRRSAWVPGIKNLSLDVKKSRKKVHAKVSKTAKMNTMNTNMGGGELKKGR